MSILDIVADVILESGRDDLEDNKRIVLKYINNYKLSLQRDKRYTFAIDNDHQFVATQNVRTTVLPDDYLSIICIRRPQLGLVGVTQDVFGNQFTITKEVTLHPWVDHEMFVEEFPLINSEGASNAGRVNDYLLQANSVVWGPIPIETETFYIDYYKLFPEYNLTDNLTDAFITYFRDGLYYRALEMVFTSWIPDAKKKAIWAGERKEAEGGLKKYQVQRDAFMHTTLNLPDL